MELIGLGITTAGALSGQPEIAGGGIAIADSGGALGVGAAVLQFNAGLFQGLSGNGYGNAKNAAISLVTGLAVARFIKGSAGKGYRTVSQRASDRFLNRSSLVVGGAFDALSSYVDQLSPQQVICP